ncbi:hypothetical protein AB0A74_06935 [Saccharothrix sp. NPDC042600]|uniref:hypothetical protein n=1 Tax=Saccharothrix TaxID=2071 RepID=UPI0034068F33|nr:hypothetical protein GCM10017745_30920 [Saccharothrix mutabilis subsp. capreolus]
MLEADPDLVTALGEAERINTTLTRLGGRDLTTQVTAWAVDRAYDSDLPAPMRATNGSASAELRLTLSGPDPTTTAAQLYSPYAPSATADIARPGQSAVHGWGIDGNALPAFRGTVRDRIADSRTGLVELSALDGAERLRDAARLPAVISPNATNIASGTWVVDHLLREAGIHSTPPPRPDCFLYASMHGGVVPDIGYYRSHTNTPATYRSNDVPWQMAFEAYTTPYTVRWDPRTRTTIGGRALFTELWTQNPTSSSSAGYQVRLGLVYQTDTTTTTLYWVADFAADTITCGVSGTSNQSSTTSNVGLLTKGTYHIGVRWAWSGRQPVARCHITGPGITGGYKEIGFAAFTALGEAQMSHVELTSGLATEAVQVCARPQGLVRSEFEPAWTRGAVVQGYTTQYTAIPPVQASSWEVISAVAKAEQATAEFDPYGVFRYRSNSRFRSPGTPALTVTSSREIASLRVSEAIDSVRNVVDVPYEQYRAGANAERFTDSGTRSIPPGGILTLTFDYDVTEYDSPPPVLYTTTIPANTSRVRFSPNSSGTSAIVGGIESTTERDGATLHITFRNTSGATMWMLTDTGTNSLSVWSQRLASGSPARLSLRRYAESSRTLYGPQVYRVPATPWIQQWNNAAQIADYLLGMAARPLPVLGDVEILPDPRITLGDLVQVIDNVGATLSTPAWVVGIRTSGDNTGRVRQVLTLRATLSTGPPADAGLFPDPPLDPDARAVLAREGVPVP